jgi:hypothetical protein
MGRGCFIPIRFLLALTLTVVVCLCAPAAEKSPWLEIHSTHFTVITDAGEKKGREVALRFEQMRAVFAGLLSKEKLYQPLPVTILAFKSDKAYYQLAPLKNGQPTDAPGFFLPGEDQNFFVLNVFEEESWRAVTHDLAHMLLNANYPPAQGWFDEGLAEYFSSVRVDNKEVEIGSDPELHASVTTDALQQQHDTHPPQSLTELLGAQVWLSMADLFTMKHDTTSYHEGTHNTLYYAQSWMVMHYLLHEKKVPEPAYPGGRSDSESVWHDRGTVGASRERLFSRADRALHRARRGPPAESEPGAGGKSRAGVPLPGSGGSGGFGDHREDHARGGCPGPVRGTRNPYSRAPGVRDEGVAEADRGHFRDTARARKNF